MSVTRLTVARPLARTATDTLAAAISQALRPQRMKWRTPAVLMLAALSIAPGMSHAQSQWLVTANGGVGDWNTAANWVNGLPNATSEADIGASTVGTAQLIGTGASGITSVLVVGRDVQGGLDIKSGGTLTSSDSRIGNSTGVLGTVTVQDTGSLWTSGTILLGVDGHGQLLITNGGKVTSTGVSIADDAGSQGDALVSGLGASWSTSDLTVGKNGTGTLDISNNGLTTSSSATIGSGTGSTGFVNVLAGGSWTNAGPLVVGNAGTGTLHIGSTGAGVVTSASGIVGGAGLGHVTVDGIGALWTVSGVLQLNNGDMNIINGGAVSNVDSAIDPLVGAAVTVNVNGANSVWTNTGLLTVGGFNEQPAILNISGLGLVSANSAVIGNPGLINVSGAGNQVGTLAVANSLSVGTQGTTGNGGAGGSLSITSGGAASDATGVVGATGNSAGSVTVDGTGSTWSNTGLLDVGAVGTGVLIVQAGAHAVVTGSGGTTNIGDLSGATGHVTVKGPGSLLDSPTMNVGDTGTGTLDIQDVSSVHNGSASIGAAAGGVGLVTVDGTGSAWNTDSELDVGVSGNGTLTVRNGGLASATTFNVASEIDGVGHVIVNGSGSLLQGTGQISVGGVGAGMLDVQAGGVVHGASGRIGVATGSPGQATIDGTLSAWNTDNELDVGVGGNGTLTLQNGGSASSVVFNAGSTSGGIGHVIVDGTGTSLSVTGQFGVGSAGAGTLLVQAGGTVHTNAGSIGTAAGSTGQATVDGTGSNWNTDTELDVGANGNGTLSVSNGGHVTDLNGFIGHNSGTGLVTVDGAGSLWTNSTNITVADVGHGTLTLSNGGAVQTTNGVFVALSSGSTGTINIGADVGNAPVAPGTLSGDVAFGNGSGALNFNHTGTAYNFAANISGGASGTVNALNGTTLLTGASTYTGATNVLGGKLIVDGSLGNTSTSVLAGTLGGTGSIAGPVHVFSGAHLAPGQGAGTLTTGALTLDSGSLLDYDLGTSGVVGGGTNDLLEVHGNLVLDGSLNVTDIGGFGAGVYRLIDYTGTLTDNTLDLGTLPGGTNANNLFVQTSVAGQVALIDNAGLLLGFWDGAAPGGLNNGAIEGGSGTWDASNNDWTDANGSVDGAWTDGQFAVFGGTAGAVDVVGQRSIAGLQFMSNYTLNATAGNGLVIAGANSMIRVDPGMQATINAAISGAGGLDKTDAGTLVLGGSNTYTGGTFVHGGVLSVSADDNLGAAGTRVTLDGGTLSVAGTGFNTTARAFTLGANGGSLDIADAGNTFNLAQTLDGGGLSKLGAGTLVLGGANTYSGGTAVQSGTLSVSADQNLGAAAGGLTLNGTTLQVTGTAFNTTARNVTLVNGGSIDIVDAGNTLDFTQAVSGDGGLTKLGAGTLALSGVNSYTGGTSVQGGTLSVVADNNLGSASGGVALNGSTLRVTGTAFNTTARNITLGASGGSLDIADAGNVFTLAGSLGGNGNFTKLGAGTLVFGAGSNGYTGVTTIAEGTVQGDSSSLVGAITNHAALVFNQAGDGIFAGTLAGEGSVTKSGAGTLVVNDANTLTGTTTVTGGGLVVGDDTHANASLAGNVVVNAGSSIGGIGSIGGLDLAGMLSPGNSIGTLHVAGDASFEKGSTFQVETTPDGQADRLDVAGKVTILGGTVLALGQDGNWAPRTDYTIINAGQGVTGQFDGVADNLAFLAPSLSYGANAVTLTLSRNSVDFTTVAQTPNQRATAGAAEALGAGQPVYDAVEKLDAPTARAAFDKLSGEIHASARTALIDDSRYVREAINRHLLGMDDGARGDTANGSSVWTSVTGHWGDHDGNSNAARLQADGSGLIVGADTGVGSDTRLGAILGHSQNSLQLDARDSSAHVTADQLGFYGSTAFGAIDLRAGAAYSWQDIDTTRHVAFGDFSESLGARGHARTGQVYAEGGYRFTSDSGNQFEPFLNATHVQLHTDAMNENGGSAALSTGSDSSAVNTATLGLRDAFRLSGGAIAAHGSLGWQQAWGDLTPVSTMHFAGGDAFDISGVPVARHALVADAGLSFRVAAHTEVDASYMGQFGGDVKDQGARLSLNMTF